MDDSKSKKLTCQLKIGLVTNTVPWVQLLSQIGVDYEKINLRKPDLIQHYSVIIVNEQPNRDALQVLRSYHEKGGALLDTGPYLRFLEGNVFVDRKLDQILPSAEGPFHYVGRVDLHQTATVYEKAQYLENTVYLPEQGKNERIGFLGWDLGEALLEYAATRKSFYTEDYHEPNEIVSKVSRAPIRRTITEILKRLHHARNLPFLHLSPIPDGKQRFFGFRVDTDYGTQEKLGELHELAVKHNISMSWFLHVEAHHDWLDYFHSFSDDQEIAVHGYRHQTYRSYDKNYENIEEAVRLLEDHSLDYRGFCAPYGLWNRGLQRAIEAWRFDYSSEFAFDYDNYPSSPLKKIGASPVLQVPIHPLGVGRLQHAGASHEQIFQYFQHVIDQQASRLEPVILYHHPEQAGISIFDKVFKNLQRDETSNKTMGEYAKWWRKRQQLRFEATYNKGKITFQSHNGDHSHTALVFTEEDTYKSIKPDDNQSLEQIADHKFNPETPLAVKRQQKESYYRYELIKTGLLDFMHRMGG